MSQCSLFLSSPSAGELTETRVRLAAHLRSAGSKLVNQKELVETGENTLVKLARTICQESTLVLRVLGASPQRPEPVKSRRAIAARER